VAELSTSDWTQYRALADQHRPTEQSAIAEEIRRLHREGLTARDVADAMRLDVGVVLSALHWLTR
jgi:hypothetical protein